MATEVTISDFPEDPTLQKWFRPLIEHGSTFCASNLQTTPAFLRTPRVELPLSVNEAEWDNSWICSPWNHYITYAAEEIDRARAEFNFPCIAIAPAGKTKFSANRNIWGIDNFQSVRDHYPDMKFVQIGLPSETLLENVIDARGRSLRDTGAILKNSIFFLGHQGGFMHLNKAVGKTSVLIFGGYIRPDIVGYRDDVNLYSEVDCSPCYTSEEKQKDCQSMKCMKMIAIDMVIAAVGDMLKKTGNIGSEHED